MSCDAFLLRSRSGPTCHAQSVLHHVAVATRGASTASNNVHVLEVTCGALICVDVQGVLTDRAYQGEVSAHVCRSQCDPLLRNRAALRVCGCSVSECQLCVPAW
eukprot:3956311-Prymnesium_polylepis.1